MGKIPVVKLLLKTTARAFFILRDGTILENSQGINQQLKDGRKTG